MMTGLKMWTFWLSNIIVDFGIYIVSVGLMIAVMLGMDVKETFTSYGGGGESI